MNNYLYILILIACIFIILQILPLSLWITAKASKVEVSLFTLTSLKINKYPVNEIVECLIIIKKGELKGIDIDDLTSLSKAGGDIKMSYML